MDKKENIDVLIVCALKDEFEQIVGISSEFGHEGWQKKATSDGWLAADASFVLSVEKRLTVRVTWSAFMGREEASSLVHKRLSEANYNCIAMTGICAGRRGKVELGDVIFADRLWSYDSGKRVKEEGKELFQGDMLQYRPSAAIVQRMQNLSVDAESWPIKRPKLTLEAQEEWVIRCIDKGLTPAEHKDFQSLCPDWPLVLDRLLSKCLVTKGLALTEEGKEQASEYKLWNPLGNIETPPFSIHVAPIATGAAVVEDESLFNRLAGSMRKVLGVDMEASALGAIGNISDIPVIVAKAVSDFGDTYKDDRYRHFASQASARAMLQFLIENADIFSSHHSPTNNSTSEQDLLFFLAEEYPDISSARSVWKRAGGSNGDLANNANPKDMWLNIWSKSKNGAVVTPSALLKEVSNDFPNNLIIQKFIDVYLS